MCRLELVSEGLGYLNWLYIPPETAVTDPGWGFTGLAVPLYQPTPSADGAAVCSGQNKSSTEFPVMAQPAQPRVQLGARLDCVGHDPFGRYPGLVKNGFMTTPLTFQR
jgi:hypothetical protein